MSRAKTAYVEAATALIEEHGPDALSVRTLAEKMGLDHTAVYRHFASLDDLNAAIVDVLLAEMLDFEPAPRQSPRNRLEAFTINVHKVLHAHPNLVPLLLRNRGTSPHADQVTRRVIELMRDLGLRDNDLVICLQLLESFVVGTHVYDLAGTPHHLDVRRQRLRRIDAPELDRATPNTDAIQRLNERSFHLGLTIILDYCEQLASKKSRP